MYKKFSFIIAVCAIVFVVSFTNSAFGYYPTLDVSTGALSLDSTNVTGYGSFNIILQSANDDLDVFALNEISPVQQGPQDKVPTANIEAMTLHVPKLRLLMGKFDAQWYEVDMLIVILDNTLQFIVEKATITTQPEDFVPLTTSEEDVSENADQSSVPGENSDEIELESSEDVTDEDRGFYDPLTRFTVKIHNLSTRWNAALSIKFQDWWESTRTSDTQLKSGYTTSYWWSNNYDTEFVLKYHDARTWWHSGGTTKFYYNGWNQTVTCRLKDYYDTTWRRYLLTCDCKSGDFPAYSVWW
ncbi:MAG: hypothetical protein HQK70_08015 [Desulfamplus sp.]|nr:hypothetical protein [Desulfamplus sp.]